MQSEPQYKFYEKVRIQTTDSSKSHLNGQFGGILGRVQTEDGKSWYYSVLLDDAAESWAFFEHELEHTGVQGSRDDYLDGSSVRIVVDPDGTGRIVPENDD